MSLIANQNESIAILQQFNKQLATFLDELCEQFPNEEHIYMARILIENQIPIEEVMKQFASKVLPHKHLIEGRDEEFFLTHDASFFGLDANDEVNHFKNLWTKVDVDDKYVIWQWFDLFVKLAERYVALNLRS